MGILTSRNNSDEFKFFDAEQARVAALQRTRDNKFSNMRDSLSAREQQILDEFVAKVVKSIHSRIQQVSKLHGASSITIKMSEPYMTTPVYTHINDVNIKSSDSLELTVRFGRYIGSRITKRFPLSKLGTYPQITAYIYGCIMETFSQYGYTVEVDEYRNTLNQLLISWSTEDFIALRDNATEPAQFDAYENGVPVEDIFA